MTHQQTRLSSSTGKSVLGSVKTLFELAEAGLRGIGIPGVEAIAAVPLRIISYYEVCELVDEAISSNDSFV